MKVLSESADVIGARQRILDAAPASRKTAMREAILAGPLLSTLGRLAMPTITVLVAQTLGGVIETWYVSRLGTNALVGVIVVFPVWLLMTMMSAGVIGGASPPPLRALSDRLAPTRPMTSSYMRP